MIDDPVHRSVCVCAAFTAIRRFTQPTPSATSRKLSPPRIGDAFFHTPSIGSASCAAADVALPAPGSSRCRASPASAARRPSSLTPSRNCWPSVSKSLGQRVAAEEDAAAPEAAPSGATKTSMGATPRASEPTTRI